MRMQFAKYLTALALGCLAAATQGEVLSPNAEILLARRNAGKMPMKVSTADRSVVETDDTEVSAYVFVDNAGAVDAISALGVTVRGNYGEFVTAAIPVALLEEVGAVEGVRYISVANTVSLLNDYSRERTGVDDVHIGNDLPRPFTGKGVVVGIIDSGVEYGHLAFRQLDGSGLRIKAVWEQMTMRGTAPEKFGYGAELRTPEEILGATYDTSQTYHGSHTMGIAAGADVNNIYYGVAPDADIVFVSFKNDDACIADAIQYIFDYADEVDKPCVINMSLGEHTGPHNGTSVLDRFIDSVTGPGRIIVGACGNEGETKLHSTETFTENDITLKTMLTFAKDVTHKYHYIDIWGSAGTNFQVQLCSAMALKGNVTYWGKVCDTANPQGAVVEAFYVEEVGFTGSVIMKSEINPVNGQPHVSVECQIDDIASGRVPGIIITGEPGQRVDLWNYGGHEFASNGKAGWTDGTTEGTVGEIGGTAFSIIPVGSYDARDRIYWTSGGYSVWSENFPYEADHHSVFSSYGPTADGRIAPAVLAPGNPVISAINRYAYQAMGWDLTYMTNGVSTNSDGFNSYYGYNSGTSMAAPYVAGTIALMLEANPGLTPQDAREIVEQTANTGDYMGQLPNNEYGAGLLNSLECVKQTITRSGVETVRSENAAENIRVWNEASTVYISVTQLSAGATAVVYTSTGHLVGSFQLTQPLTSLDSSAWGKGLFIVKVSDGEDCLSVKLAL